MSAIIRWAMSTAYTGAARKQAYVDFWASLTEPEESELTMNIQDQLSPHFTHVDDIDNQFSSNSNSSVGMCRFINFVNKPLWFTLSNTFDESIAHIFTVLPSSIILSTMVRTVWIAFLQPTPFLKPYLSTVSKKSAKSITASKVSTKSVQYAVLKNFRY